MIKYKLRPGYGSKKLLIEFVPNVADADFFTRLFKVLKDVGTRVENIKDLWMNDEILLDCECDHGHFVVSKDIWNLVFIMAPDNQVAITKIDEALSKSDSFQKEPVKNEDYS